MSYAERIDEWRRKAQEKAKQLEDKYKIKEKLDEGIDAAKTAVRSSVETVGDVARAGYDAVSAGAQVAQEKIHNIDLPNLDEEHVKEVFDNVKRAGEKASETVKEGAEIASEVVKNSAEKASEVFKAGSEKASEAFKSGSEKASEAVKAGAEKASEAFKSGAQKANSAASDFSEKARNYYEKASDAYNFGHAATKAAGSFSDTIGSAVTWVKENPGKATLVTISLAAGVQLGRYFPQLDVIILGKKGHWFFRSAILAYGTRKLSEKYLEYLKHQEELLAGGHLSAAERDRVEFQRSAAKYVGAPLLGTFHIAAGLAMWSEILSPDHIVGFPIDLILGQNPLLETVWLFSNGLICIHNGYEFIMMALADEAQIQKVVRDIKGLLPMASA